MTTKPTGNLEVFSAPTAEEAAVAAGQALGERLLQTKEHPVLLLLSGGSALRILDYIDPFQLGENLTLTVSDERFSEDPKINNFAQLQDTDFFLKAMERDVSFFGTLPRQDDTLQALAKRYENNLKQWQQENPQGKIMAVLGMGADGHTAGIMPFPENPALFHRLFDSGGWVAAYDASGKTAYPQRVTTTISLLKTIDEAFAFVIGKEKQPALQKVIDRAGNLEATPALAWRQIKKITIFTDIKT